MAQALQALAAAGVAVWLDDLSRSRIQSGSLIRPVEQGAIVGLAADPTIFAKAIASGLGCEEQMRALALRGTAVGEASGRAFHWTWTLALSPGNPLKDVTMSQWWYLLDDGSLMNRTTVSKLGVTAAEVTEHFAPVRAP